MAFEMVPNTASPFPKSIEGHASAATIPGITRNIGLKKSTSPAKIIPFWAAARLFPPSALWIIVWLAPAKYTLLTTSPVIIIGHGHQGALEFHSFQAFIISGLVLMNLSRPSIKLPSPPSWFDKKTIQAIGIIAPNPNIAKPKTVSDIAIALIPPRRTYARPIARSISITSTIAVKLEIPNISSTPIRFTKICAPA